MYSFKKSDRRLGILLASKDFTGIGLTSGEAIEFAKLNAGVVHPSKTGNNPYYLEIKIFGDIEERYNNPLMRK